MKDYVTAKERLSDTESIKIATFISWICMMIFIAYVLIGDIHNAN